MLKALRIENFALIEALELEFAPGLTVLTGETGAGKSIILDALDAALGGTTSGKAIRTGSSKALIEATFELTDSISAWLAEADIDPLDDGLVCSREISERTSRSRINGVVVNKQQLLSLRSRLLEITAQGQTWQLQDPNTQRLWLDSLGGAPLAKALQQVQTHYQAWHSAKTKLQNLQQSQQQRAQQLDLWIYQHEELQAAQLDSPDELDQLRQERDRLAHSVELLSQSEQVYAWLYQNERGQAVADLLGQAEKTLTEMCRYDPDLQPLLASLSSALIQIEDVGQSLGRYGEDLDTDPERLATLEARIQRLKSLCRKYGPSLAEVIAHAEFVAQQLEGVQTGESDTEALATQVEQHYQALVAACESLSQQRRQVGERLAKDLVAQLKPLAMQAVQFKVELLPIPPTATGQDRVQFLLSPNPGEPLQPLGDIASGGEMSRVLLALKSVFSAVDPVATLVFDEIDVGVSGKVAQAIATKLHSISRQHQVLCVTHQPLVAAMADTHLRVQKTVKQKRTAVYVETLSDRDRPQELAQLAGGYSADEALSFAASLLNQAAQIREGINSPS